MEIIFLPSTVNDLNWMRSYYTDVFPDGQKRAKIQYERVIQLLKETPLVGHKLSGFTGVYEFSIPNIPFSFIYRIEGNQIQVLRVWDERQDRGNL